MNSHLSILHLFGTTPDEKINSIADIRLGRLLKELKTQEITDYSIIGGFYDPFNTKQAIHQGHRGIVQSAKDKGLPNCIIAEDDIVFTSAGAWKYFLSQIPEDYDLFMGLVYSGEINLEYRVINGFSAGCSLYVINARFYDFFLSLDTNTHIDRELGSYCYQYKFFVVNPQVVVQRGGFSYNLKRSMQYTVYMEGKDFYGRDGQVFSDGVWQLK